MKLQNKYLVLIFIVLYISLLGGCDDSAKKSENEANNRKCANSIITTKGYINQIYEGRDKTLKVEFYNSAMNPEGDFIIPFDQHDMFKQKFMNNEKVFVEICHQENYYSWIRLDIFF